MRVVARSWELMADVPSSRATAKPSPLRPRQRRTGAGGRLALFLSASTRSPMASFRIESTASSGRTLGRALVLPFLAKGITRLKDITS
eukprot:12110925-Alexandrium_andersonii.AAC.1